MFDVITLEECLVDLPSMGFLLQTQGRRKVNEPAPYRRVATAINGDPREAAGDIFAIGNNEYYVPLEERYGNGGKLTATTFRLDLAERIVSRPNGTRQIFEMVRDKDIPSSDFAILARAVEEENPAQPGYAVQIIHPQP